MSEWIDAKKSLPDYHAIIRVRRANGDEIKAYYFSDGAAWLQFYGVRPSRFQDYKTNEFLNDVTHWKSE